MNMITVTIPKREYQKLVDKAMRYEYVRQLVKDDIFSPPPTSNVETVMKEFRGVGRYNKKFLQSFERGLRRSSYFKK